MCIRASSGGNCALKGNAPPGSGARSAGEGAFFEHEQTVKNACNLALETVSEAGRPLAVFGAGTLFPSDHHDQALVKEIGALEQAFYFGTHTVRALGERPALTLEETQAIMTECVSICNELSSMNLRFLLFPHRACRHAPVEHSSGAGGYKPIQPEFSDYRRPLCHLPPTPPFQPPFSPASS